MLKIYQFDNINIANKNVLRRITEIISNSDNNLIISVATPENINKYIDDLFSNRNLEYKSITDFMDRVRVSLINLSNQDHKIIQDIKVYLRMIEFNLINIGSDKIVLDDIEEKIGILINQIIVKILNHELLVIDIISPDVYFNFEFNDLYKVDLFHGEELFYEYDFLIISAIDFKQFVKYNTAIISNRIQIQSVNIWTEEYIEDGESIDEETITSFIQLSKNIILSSFYFENNFRILHSYKNILEVPEINKKNIGNTLW